MKIKKIIATILVLIMSTAVFVGCGLFSKNLDKQLDLVVAEIQDSEFHEKVTRRELIVYYYNNDGQSWVDEGSSTEEVLKAFLNQLISRKIFLIEAKKRFTNEGKNSFSGDYVTKYADYKGSEFLSNEELRDIELSVMYTNQERINGYMTDILNEWYPLSETPEEKTYNPAPAAKPEAPAKPPKAPKPWELPEEYFSLIQDPVEREKSRQKLVKDLEAEALLELYRQIKAENFNDDDFVEQQTLSLIEQKIIEKYRDVIYAEIRDGIAGVDTVAALEALFNEMRMAQIEEFGLDPQAFFTKASNPTEGDFLLFYPNYNTNFTYIAIKNLLVKFDEETEARLTELREYMYSDDPAYIAIREELIKLLTAEDLRDPHDIEWEWGGNAYDEVFGPDEDGNGEFDVLAFFNFIKAELDKVSPESPADPNYDYNARKEKFVELIYTYGEDPGMFDSVNDYIVAPEPVMGGTETFVVEFAAKAREFTEVGQLSWVVTDYGLHVMMCTDIIEVKADGTLGVELQFDYNDILNKNYDSVTYKFFDFIFTNKKDTGVTAIQTETSDTYIANGKVKKYYKNIEDLWK